MNEIGRHDVFEFDHQMAARHSEKYNKKLTIYVNPIRNTMTYTVHDHGDLKINTISLADAVNMYNSI